jgi:hypothetical protein
MWGVSEPEIERGIPNPSSQESFQSLSERMDLKWTLMSLKE